MSLHRPLVLGAVTAAALSLVLTAAPAAQVGTVKSFQKVSNGGGGLPVLLNAGDNFGWSAAGMGDLDGDGVRDVAVGALLDDAGAPGTDRGAVWVLDMHTNGTVKAATKITTGSGGFTYTLQTQDWFGWSVANIGDIDKDGVTDLAVGALQDDSSAPDGGAVWILFMNSNGTVKSQKRITAGQSGFITSFPGFEWFGSSVAGIGDLDGDGVPDIAVGAHGDSDLGNFRGAVFILFLKIDGTVKNFFKINDLTGNLGAVLHDGDEFGWATANIGDLDRDGINDLAVSADLDDDGGQDRGAVYILFMGTAAVKSSQKISNLSGGFSGVLDNRDRLGSSLGAIGDFNGDGTADVAAGAVWDDDGGKDEGAVWNLFLNEDGTVKSSQKISATAGSFAGPLAISDEFGVSAGVIGDLNNDGTVDLAVGADRDDDALIDSGAAWMLMLKGGTFTNLGKALKGSNGVPSLGGDGTLIAGDPVTFTLGHAKPSNLSFLVIGVSQINAPLKGGVLVPSINVLIGLVTDATGHIVLSTPWPAGFPSGLSLYYQFWMNDAGGVHHFAASNGLKGTTP